MLPADQLAVPDKKHLNHRVPAVAGQRDNILVLPVTVRNFLLRGNLLHTVIQIPVTDCILKFKGIGSLLHIFFQFLQRLLIAAV